MHTIPVRHITTVYHAGALARPTEAIKRNPHSHEGIGLSVSRCPNSWRRITALGDRLAKLTNGEGRFLDVLALRGAPAARAISDWALAAGIVDRADVYRVHYFDEEGEDWRSFDCASRKDAIGEAREHHDGPVRALFEGGGPRSRPAIERILELRTTHAGEAVTGFRAGDTVSGEDAAVAAWAAFE